jgi:tetrahydromethanopterin S-methyltransferase subunit E
MKPLNVLGLIIFSFGGLALISFGLYKFLNIFIRDDSVPFLIKWGIAALLVGLIIILISLIAERIRDKKDTKI